MWHAARCNQMVDVYGQLSPLYATQKGGQMEPTGKMVRRLLESP